MLVIGRTPWLSGLMLFMQKKFADAVVNEMQELHAAATISMDPIQGKGWRWSGHPSDAVAPV